MSSVVTSRTAQLCLIGRSVIWLELLSCRNRCTFFVAWSLTPIISSSRNYSANCGCEKTRVHLVALRNTGLRVPRSRNHAQGIPQFTCNTHNAVESVGVINVHTHAHNLWECLFDDKRCKMSRTRKHLPKNTSRQNCDSQQGDLFFASNTLAQSLAVRPASRTLLSRADRYCYSKTCCGMTMTNALTNIGLTKTVKQFKITQFKMH